MIGKKNGFTGFLRPSTWLSKNPLGLLGAALALSSGIAMVGYWIATFLNRVHSNPYISIFHFLILPGIFLLGLLLMLVGLLLKLRVSRQVVDTAEGFSLAQQLGLYRKPMAILFAVVCVNLLVIAYAGYRGARYMETPGFCGRACHVMKPEHVAYMSSAHANIACTECHVGSGGRAQANAKFNGIRQLFEVMLHRYPRPIAAPVDSLRPAREICESCHKGTQFFGEKFVVKNTFADDEQNSQTKSVLQLHVGGMNAIGQASGIHGVHLGHIEYIAGDDARSVIPWVEKTESNGSRTVYAASSTGSKMPLGKIRLMDCTDCHNRTAHVHETAEEALNHAMADGRVNPQLPYIRREALRILKMDFASQEIARQGIMLEVEVFYKNNYPRDYAAWRNTIHSTALQLANLYEQNVFPDMKVKWETRTNNIGHTSSPGCFRCHDGDHSTSGAAKTITNDCAACHNLLAVDEKNPKLLTDLGL